MEKLKIFTPIALYGILIGLLNSFAFWGRFSINPLQFASALDIAKVSAWPLASGGLIFFINALVSSATDDDWLTHTDMDSIHLPIPSWLKWVWKLLWGLGATFLLGWLLYIVSHPARWFGVGFCVLILASGSLERQKIIRKLIPSYCVRVPAIYLALLAPFIAVGAGALAGETIQEGKGAFLLDATHSYLPANFDASDSYAFVGILGNLYVFYSRNKSISMMRLGDGQGITLKKNPLASSHPFF